MMTNTLRGFSAECANAASAMNKIRIFIDVRMDFGTVLSNPQALSKAKPAAYLAA
jgi:hypothetical protein